MSEEEKHAFFEKENEKLTTKVHLLAEALTNVLEKSKEKQDNRPPQVFIRKHEEFGGKFWSLISRNGCKP